MKRLSNDEVRKLQLDLLRSFNSFCLENGKQKFGRIVRIQANISKIKTEKEPFVTYTIIDENGDLFERPASEVKR